MSIRVSQAFSRTSANAIDETMTLTKAQMLAVNDNLMPAYYFTVCQDDGFIYLYDKTATASAETGKFKKFEGGGSTPSGGEMITVTLLASGWTNGSQTVTATGVKADSVGVIGMLNTATSAQLEAARDAVITVDAVAADSITFLCEETPEIDIPVGVLADLFVPDGGTTGQVLVKQSSTDGDADWEDPAQGGHVIQNASGTNMTERAKLQFVGATVTDDSTNDKTVVTVDSDNDKADTTAIAPAFDDTATYAIGDIVSYEGKIYEFTAAHTGAWAAADVTETDVTEMTESLSAAELQAIEDAFDATTLQSGQFASTYDIIDLRGTELIVGKLIEADGTEKVLYQRVIDCGLIPNGTQDDYNIYSLSTGISFAIVVGSYLLYTNGRIQQMPRVNPDYNYDYGVQVDGIPESTLHIRFDSGASNTGITANLIVILRYTKTTS